MGWTDRMIERDLERERELVSHPERPATRFRSLVWSVVILSAAFAAIFAGEPWAVLGQVTIAALAGWGISGGLRRKQAYRNGWLEGRFQMVSSLAEAQRRGFSPDEWAMRELERDTAVLGYSMEDFLSDHDGEDHG